MKTFISIYITNHPIFRKIKYYLFPKTYMLSEYNRNARRVRRIIDNYFNEQKLSICSLQITDINVNLKRNRITITLNRPGLFIGKAGKHFDCINLLLNRSFNRVITIKIKESYIF